MASKSRSIFNSNPFLRWLTLPLTIHLSLIARSLSGISRCLVSFLERKGLGGPIILHYKNIFLLILDLKKQQQ